MRNKIRAFVCVAVMACVITLTGCAGCSRTVKSIGSDLGGGLYREVTVYDYSGNKIQSWEGKFDVSSSESEVFFDVDGKRIIIHGGIVINEEK